MGITTSHKKMGVPQTLLRRKNKMMMDPGAITIMKRNECSCGCCFPFHSFIDLLCLVQQTQNSSVTVKISLLFAFLQFACQIKQW